MLPIFVSLWSDYDNSLFEVGESKSFASEAEAQVYVGLWRAYAAFGTNMVDGFIVNQLLVTDFYHDEVNQLSINSKFINL
jgi:hypothetical protein